MFCSLVIRNAPFDHHLIVVIFALSQYRNLAFFTLTYWFVNLGVLIKKNGASRFFSKFKLFTFIFVTLIHWTNKDAKWISNYIVKCYRHKSLQRNLSFNKNLDSHVFLNWAIKMSELKCGRSPERILLSLHSLSASSSGEIYKYRTNIRI